LKKEYCSYFYSDAPWPCFEKLRQSWKQNCGLFYW